jgi:hypothetical protein
MLAMRGQSRAFAGEVMRSEGPPRSPRRKYGLTDYRLFFLHSTDRHISRAFEFQAKDDEAAIRTAESWREGRAAELWSGPRKIRAWDADRPEQV